MTEAYSNLLVVEDSDDDFYAFMRACRQVRIDLQVERCSSVVEARERLARYVSEPARRVPLVFLDLNLPGTDGRTFLVELKTNDLYRAIPVVIYSTSSDQDDIRLCYRNNANAYHVKPIDFGEMRDDLRGILEYWTKRAVLPPVPL